jgi:hypothetical protein
MTTEQTREVISEQKNEENRPRLEALYWGGVLLWAGLVFAADSLGLLPQIGESDAWSWVFLGAGLYGTMGNLYRTASPTFASPTAWDYVWSGFVLLIGLGGMTSVDIFWPVALILVGGAILVNTLRRRD